MNDLGRRGGCTMWLLPLFMLVAGFVFFQWVEPATAMGDNLAGTLLDQAQSWLTDKWEAIYDPIYGWIALLILFLIALGFISWVIPFEWTKKLNGFLAALAIAFTFGGWYMGKSYKSRLEREKAKRKAAEARRTNQGQGDGRSEQKWPWQW